MDPCKKIKIVIDRSIGCDVSFTKSEWVHIRECKACWEYYNRSIELERLFASGGKSSVYPSEFELARIGKYISSYEPVSSIKFVSQSREWIQKIWNQIFGRRLVYEITAALLVGTILITYFTNYDRDVHDSNRIVAENGIEKKSTVHSGAFAYLGATKAFQGSSNSIISARNVDKKMHFTVRAVCQTQDGKIWSLSEKPGPQEAASCPLDGDIGFAYTTSKSGYLYVFVIDPAKDLKWLAPNMNGTEQYFIAKTDELTPLKFFLNCSKDYSKNLLGGKYEVTFVKTKWPLDIVFQFARSFQNSSNDIQVNHLSVYFRPVT